MSVFTVKRNANGILMLSAGDKYELNLTSLGRPNADMHRNGKVKEDYHCKDKGHLTQVVHSILYSNVTITDQHTARRLTT